MGAINSEKTKVHDNGRETNGSIIIQNQKRHQKWGAKKYPVTIRFKKYPVYKKLGFKKDRQIKKLQ